MRIRRISLIVAPVVVALLALASVFSVFTVWAGDPDSPAGPTDPAAQMYTLEQIYDRLSGNGNATKMTSFTEPSSGPPTGTMHTLDEIYELAWPARVPKTGAGDIGGYAEVTGEDGHADMRKGVAWPNPRFTDNADGTVTDNLTGLIWLKDADCMGRRQWGTGTNETFDVISDLNSGTDFTCDSYTAGTFNDWRLPNVRELQSLVHYGVYNPAVPNTAGTGKWTSGDPFTGVQSNYYWSCTTNANYTTSAWYVLLNYGLVDFHDKSYDDYVWPVRGGQ
jgi:hypothetical protein